MVPVRGLELWIFSRIDAIRDNLQLDPGELGFVRFLVLSDLLYIWFISTAAKETCSKLRRLSPQSHG